MAVFQLVHNVYKTQAHIKETLSFQIVSRSSLEYDCCMNMDHIIAKDAHYVVL